MIQSPFRSRLHVLRVIAVGACVYGLATATASAFAQEKNDELPEFGEIQAAVQKQLRSKRGYKSDDILSRGDVKSIFAALAKIGWEVADAMTITASLLDDGDYLVKQLRSRKGVPFMQKLSGSRGTYDRLDQLRRLKYGNRRIREFINAPGGHTMILYMTKTKGGKNLNRQLSRVPGGRGFGKPTRRIYTEKQLLDRLKKSHAAAAAKLEKPPVAKSDKDRP